MLLKRAKAREHFFTFSTLVRFILAVYWHMDFEVGGACKASATFITFERLLSYKKPSKVTHLVSTQYADANLLTFYEDISLFGVFDTLFSCRTS